MQNSFDVRSQVWFSFLDAHGQMLALQSQRLLEREKRVRSVFDDYSFVVFPLAKAYEGFLKKFLLEMGVLTKEQYFYRQFRIGRSLNPDISDRFQDEWWLYDDVVSLCTPQLARKLWNAWVECRNHVFHFFADDTHQVSLQQAEKLLHQLSQSMQEAMQCASNR